MVRLSVLSAGCLAWLGALSGCRTATPPEGPAQPAAPAGVAAAPAPKGFAEIGDRRITEVVAPDSFVVIRCRYAVGPEERDLLLEEPMSGAPEGARKDLSRLLSLLEVELAAPRGPAEGADAERKDPPAAGLGGSPRAYELAVGETWLLALSVFDLPLPGTSGLKGKVLARVNRRELALDASAPELLAHLRGLSFKALRLAMAKPRRALDWHVAAIAGFLESSAQPDPELLVREGKTLAGLPDREGKTLAGLRKEILEHLESQESQSAVVEAILAQARSFEESEVTPYLRSHKLPLRLLALTREGWYGKRSAVGEILTLSLEYSGQDRLFDRAMRSLFPAALNPLLHKKCPEGPRAGIAFVREVRANFAKAEHVERLGWTLEGSKGTP